MKKTILTITCIVFMIHVGTTKEVGVESEDLHQKRETIENVLNAIGMIKHIANSELKDGEWEIEIDKIIANLKSIDEMVYTAVMSWNISYPQTAGCQRFDLKFDYAYRKVVYILGTDKSLNSLALEGLQSIKYQVNPDGGESLRLKEAIEAQKKKLKESERISETKKGASISRCSFFILIF